MSVAQKEEAPESADTIQDEVAPQVNGEKVEKESPDANDISAVEEKATGEKPDDTSEVGFKKIFRFVGFKFTVKKDKSEEKDPVKLLTVRDKEAEHVIETSEPVKKEVEEEVSTAGEKSIAEEKEADTEETTAEAEVSKVETTDATPEGPAADATDEAVKDEEPEKAGESTPPPQETTLSSFRKLFSGGLFSNLRKKTSIKKTKEGDEKEEETEETAVVEEKEKVGEQESNEDETATPEGTKPEPLEEAPTTVDGEKSEPIEEAPATSEEAQEPEVTGETHAPCTATDETTQEREKTETAAEEGNAPAEVTSEAELLSSQEKAKPQGSPLKKLFAGAGLKKLSAKKHKTKKDTETKVAESGEQTAEHLQSSTESTEAPKADSGPSSPEESGEHTIAVEVPQVESSQEAEGEVASDGEKKKEGITAWSSFKKLVTPKRRVKRSSESEDEATGEKPAKSATLSSSESAALADKSVEEEAKENKPTEEEPQTENTEKLVSSTEEPKKKMDTSVSWEALMCMGGAKKRTRKTSDSDEEDTKIEEEASASAAVAAVEEEQEAKTEAANVTSQNAESDGEAVTTGEPVSPPEKESTWDTLKRMVMSKNKAKSEEKPEEAADQVHSDSEAPKDESSFSLRKFFPGRRKKKAEKQASSDVGSGEEDSDTPAVVPLSEYDQQVEAAQETQAEPVEPAAVQIKVSAEDRSPSWIPATVEGADDKHDQLSDIPEEAENAATPKSVDTEIAEDETENQAKLSPEAPALTRRRLSIAEVKPVAPAPAAETTDVPHEPKSESATEVIEGIDAHISEVPLQTSVTVEDVQVEVAAEKTEHEPPTENAQSKTNTILEPHAHDEAMAICTGLGTKEIAKVALEKAAAPVVECLAVVRDSLSTEVSQEEKPLSTAAATVTEDEVLEAQVNQVETAELEPVVESLPSDPADIHVATEGYEPQMEKIGVVSSVMEESEIVLPTTRSENSPKAVIFDPIIPTSEAVICTQSVEITEPTVETKEVKMDMKKLAATEENTAIEEVVEVVTQEMSSTICESTKTTITTEIEPAIPAVVPTEETPVITETVVVVASDVTMESVSVSEPVVDEPNQVKETEETTIIKTEESEISAVDEQTSEKVEEATVEVQQTNEIEAQSIVIAQAVVQEAMDKVSENACEAKNSTPSATIPTPVQATATTEKEIEIAAETPVITETPVAAICEKPAPESRQELHVAKEVTDDIPIEVTESIDASAEEEKKPEEELKQAVEVKVSEEAVVVEEVEEIKTESQKEELEQVKEDVQEPSVKGAEEEVKPQPEESEQETPSEDNKEKELEIHMPVQVVLQTAQVVEEPAVEEEAVEEFDSNGPVTEDTSVKVKSPASAKKLSTLSEEPQASAEAACSQPESPSGKCAEVMAQVIEVIEEAVKEIEPVSTEITAASWAGENNNLHTRVELLLQC